MSNALTCPKCDEFETVHYQLRNDNNIPTKYKDSNMKIIITQSENSDGATCEDMKINGTHSLSVNPLYDYPEDATIERDLVSCSDVARYMEKAYQAGKNGEDFSIETIGDAPQY